MGVRNWTEYAIQRNEVEQGYQWQGDEQQVCFFLPLAYMETQWLLRLIQNQGLVPVHLVKVTHMSAGAIHIIAILPDGRYVFTARSLAAGSVSNPVAVVPRGPEPTPPTQTIPQRRVYHELQADLRSMMSGIQTQEQLDDLWERLGQIGGGLPDATWTTRQDVTHSKILPQFHGKDVH
ncbi:hypothetical protein B0H10DRAFT_1968741 [Mycena sp. CBHHK59/15]|nr:hypothetical protein B0H10DRAFT_1968741 [Mycena sp. CBHHK59/15]